LGPPCSLHDALPISRGQGVLSALERQRWQMALVEAEYLADEDHVVAALVHEGGTALEACGAVVQQRDVIDAPIQLDTGELVLAADRKSTRLNSSHVK